jgi:hypothetical protein
MIEILLAISFLVLSASLCYAIAGRRLYFSISSPVYIFVDAYLFIGIGGFLYYTYSMNYKGGIYDIGTTQDQINESLTGFLVAVGSFFLGVLVYSLFLNA